MKRKTLCLITAIVLTMSLGITGCKTEKSAPTNKAENNNFNTSGMPIVKEKVNFTLAASKKAAYKAHGELKFFKDLESKTNVHIEWDLSPEDGFQEKKNLMFAGGNLPDGFYGTWVMGAEELFKYGQQGLLIPLEDLIKDYAPNVQKILADNPWLKKVITAPDGHIYSLPRLDETSPITNDILIMNKTWLDKVGMPVPKTTEEFYNALKAFKGKDLNGNGKADEIPFTFRANHHLNGINSFFGSFGILTNASGITVKDNKVIFAPTQPEYKESIKYFNKLFAEGLADKEAFTQNDSVLMSKITRMKTEDHIVGAFTAWDKAQYVGVDDKDYVPLLPLKGPNGAQLWNKRVSNYAECTFAITSAAKNPEILMRWADQQYETRTAYEAYFGLFDVAIKERADGKIEFIAPPAGKNEQDIRQSEAPGVSSMHAVTKDMYSKMVLSPTKEQKRELDAMYKPYIVDVNYPILFFTKDENEKISQYSTDIGTYVKQMQAKWIMEGGIDSEWDAYIKKLNDMKLNDMIKQYQQALDRYNSVK